MILENIPFDNTIYAWCGEYFIQLSIWQEKFPVEVLCALHYAERIGERIILKIGCVTYPNTPEGHRAYRETLPAERSKPRISIPTAHSRVWYVGEYEKKACRIIVKTNTK